MSFTAILVGDVHLSDRAPSNCTESYNDDLFLMLEEINGIASGDVDAVVFAGDLFHSKIPSRTSHATVQRMIAFIQSCSVPVYSVVGNHDIQHDRVESLDKQPFGTLIKAGLIELDGWIPGTPLYGVPWQQDWDNAQDAFAEWCDTRAAIKLGPKLLVTHAPIYPPGQELAYENIPSWVVASWMNDSGHCYYGHIHDCHGVFEQGGVVFCNQGALARGSLSHSDVNRQPAVTAWNSSVAGVAAFQRIELTSAKPAGEVFRLAEAAERVDYRVRLDQFLAAVGSSKVSATTVETVIDEVKALGLPAPEVALAEEVLTAAIAGELDK